MAKKKTNSVVNRSRTPKRQSNPSTSATHEAVTPAPVFPTAISTASSGTAATTRTSRAATTLPKKGPVRKGPTIRKKSRRPIYLVIGTLVVLAAIVIGFVLIERQQAANSTAGKLQPVDQTVFQELIGVSSSTWGTVGTGGVTQPFTKINGATALKGSNGLPEFLYAGGEYCPNCAAERWSMINALSRFGTFSQISQIQSYEDNISTFSFEGSSYTSKYVDFVPREIYGNTVDSSGNYVSLDTLTEQQQQLFSQYDSSGGIPFIDVGNQYTLSGASYQYTTLEDSAANPLTWQNIASSLGDTGSSISQNILGTANYLTAAICEVTNQQPGSVCETSAIQQIEQTLGQTSSTIPSRQLTSSPRDISRTRRIFSIL